MDEFITWVFDPQNSNANIFALLTVLMSGIISWIISAIFFRVGNRNNLTASVLHPMKQILKESYSWKNYKALEELSQSYSAKYLRHNERLLIDNLLSAYKDACNYNYDHVCAASLFSYFKYKLKQNGIEPAYIPIYINDELIDVDVPDDLLYMEDELARIVNKYPPEYDIDSCFDGVMAIFNVHCKKNYTNENITFFDDQSLTDVLKNSQVRTDWDKKLNAFECAQASFLEMSAVKKAN